MSVNLDELQRLIDRRDEELRDIRNRFIFQGGSQYANELAYLLTALRDEVLALRQDAEKWQQRVIDTPDTLLASIAMRLDHAIGMRLEPFETDEKYKRRVRSTMTDARRIMEEIRGDGYWSQETAHRYSHIVAIDGGEHV